jgi:hypothetical protein
VIDLDHLCSSTLRGATLDKPSEMMAFSLSVSELGVLHHFLYLPYESNSCFLILGYKLKRSKIEAIY